MGVAKALGGVRKAFSGCCKCVSRLLQSRFEVFRCHCEGAVQALEDAIKWPRGVPKSLDGWVL